MISEMGSIDKDKGGAEPAPATDALRAPLRRKSVSRSEPEVQRLELRVLQTANRKVFTNTLLVAFAGLSFVVPCQLLGQAEDERASLRGIPHVYVVVDIRNDAQLLEREVGISDVGLRNRAMARLRTSRIPVVDTVTRGGGGAVLTLQLRALKEEDGASYTWSLDVSIAQHVALLRDPTIDVVAPTWGNHAFGSGPTAQVGEAIPRMVDQFLDRFINDFLAENQEQ